MANRGDAVQQFFSELEQKGNLEDPRAAAELFAETFLVAGAEGARAARRDDFGPALLRRREWLAGLGCAGAELVSLEEKWLDKRFVLAATRWRMRFGAGQEVELASTYLLDMGEGAAAILVYMTHQDLMAVLEERGILGG